MPVKQSVCIPMLNQAHIPLADFVREVAAIGYPAVEIWERDETTPELAALCRQYGLVLSQMSGHGSLPVGLNDPAQHERIEAELIASIDFAAQHGIPGVICFSGNRRAGQSEEDAITQTVRGFRRVAPYAEAKGVNLNLELRGNASEIGYIGYARHLFDTGNDGKVLQVGQFPQILAAVTLDDITVHFPYGRCKRVKTWYGLIRQFYFIEPFLDAHPCPIVVHTILKYDGNHG